jgi:hypothetical protein
MKMSIEDGVGMTDSVTRRAWHVPRLSYVGSFGAIITGSLNVGNDGGPKGKNQGSDRDLKTDIETIERPLARLGRIRTR